MNSLPEARADAGLPNRLAPLAERGRPVLETSGWLCRSPDGFRQAVLAKAIWRTAEPGDVIASSGDEIGGLIGLAEGVLGMSSPKRIAVPVIHLLHPGDWTGHIPVVTGQPRRTTTEVRAPSLYALVTQADMQRILSGNPAWWRELALQADDMAEAAVLAGTDLMVPDSSCRTAGVLLRLAGCRAPVWPKPRGDVLLSHEELATIAAVSRNTLARVLHRFETAGLVEASYRRIRILQAEALSEISQGDTA